MRLALALLVALVCALTQAAAPAAGAGDPLRSQQWGLDMIEADAAHSTSTGAGAVVAVVDTGVDAAHQDLQGRLLPGYDFVDNDATPQDGNGHGTHVTGIVAADANNGVGIEGVAPEAKILPIRVLGDDGSGDSDTVAKGIDYAVAHHADVINLSLGDVTSVVGGDDAFAAALNRALAAGVVVVAAAGNDGLPVCEQPQTSGRLLCVGAVDKRGLRSFYSSFGMGVGIMAPGGSTLPLAGEDILSTWNDGGYAELGGTSQAAPHVSGVAALLASLGVRGQAAVDRIVKTARPGPDPTYGVGIVDARAAVQGLRRVGAGGARRSAGGTAHASATFATRLRIATFLRRGLTVRCRAAASGRCVAVVRAGHTTLAKGSKALRASQPATVAARPTRAGRTRVRHARLVRARVTVRLPGARFSRAVTLYR